MDARTDRENFIIIRGRHKEQGMEQADRIEVKRADDFN
jgi:hypothetical protein